MEELKHWTMYSATVFKRRRGEAEWLEMVGIEGAGSYILVEGSLMTSAGHLNLDSSDSVFYLVMLQLQLNSVSQSLTVVGFKEGLDTEACQPPETHYFFKPLRLILFGCSP